MKKYYFLMLLLASAGSRIGLAQSTYDSTLVLALDSVRTVSDSVGGEKDIRDVFRKKKYLKPDLHISKTKEHLQFTLIPAAGYTLQTGFTILLAANTVFYTDPDDHSKSSTILASVSYTQYNQIIVPLFVNVWTKGKRYNIISNIRYMSYPSQTFGLGANSPKSGGYDIDFHYLKIHQSFLKRISSDFFAGVGYYYDFLWNQDDVPEIIDFIKDNLDTSLMI